LQARMVGTVGAADGAMARLLVQVQRPVAAGRQRER
jgi:hypothetical protein